MIDESNSSPMLERVFSAEEPELILTETTEDSVDEIAGTETEATQSEPERSEEEQEPTTARRQQNVIQEFDINFKDKLDYGDEVQLPSHHDQETSASIERAPNVSVVDNPEGRQWAQTLLKGMEYTTEREAFVPTLEDPDAEFRHKYEHNAVPMFATRLKQPPTENTNLKGERAVLNVLSHLGMGALHQQPLWHSGFWVTFKPAGDSERVELNRLIMSEKIQLGRYTYGMVFSNLTAYTVDKLMDFATAHVYDTTVKASDINNSNLRDHILVQDIPSFLTGFMCSIYPRGFLYSRSCISDPTKCTYEVNETLNLSKLQWTNYRALTDWQKTFMSARQPRRKDLAEVKRYREELGKLQKRKIYINEGRDDELVFIINSPTVTSHIDAAHLWIGNIVDAVDKLIGTDASQIEKNDLINKLGSASAMRQYAHWVESIEIGTNIIDDRETIDKTLDFLSADDAVRTQFIAGVIDAINNSTISVIGIPVFDCPKCNKTQESPIKSEQFVNIIPLETLQLFFGLHTQRMSRIMER